MRAAAKRWAVRRPVVFTGVAALGWYLVLAGLTGPLGLAGAALAAGAVPLAAIAAFRWWRETGLRWQRPNRAWWLVAPLLLAGSVHIGPELLTGLAFAVSVEIAARGAAQCALRQFGPWRVSPALALLYGGAALLYLPNGLARPTGWSGLVFAVAAGFCLSAIRWRLNTLWPLVPAHLALLQLADRPVGWLLGLAVALVAYGCWVAHRYPSFRIATRPTVRIVCLDDLGRILLICWVDPADGSCLWDLPGGGIEPGETPLQAARRELREETGFDPDCVLDRHIVVHRDAHWNNKRYVGDEPCFLARVPGTPDPRPEKLEPHEIRLMRGFHWVEPALATGLIGRVQLVTLARITDRLLADQLAR